MEKQPTPAFIYGSYEEALVAIPVSSVKEVQFKPASKGGSEIYLELISGKSWTFTGDEADAIWSGILVHGLGKSGLGLPSSRTKRS